MDRRFNPQEYAAAKAAIDNIKSQPVDTKPSQTVVPQTKALQTGRTNSDNTAVKIQQTGWTHVDNNTLAFDAGAKPPQTNQVPNHVPVNGQVRAPNQVHGDNIAALNDLWTKTEQTAYIGRTWSETILLEEIEKYVNLTDALRRENKHLAGNNQLLQAEREKYIHASIHASSDAPIKKSQEHKEPLTIVGEIDLISSLKKDNARLESINKTLNEQIHKRVTEARLMVEDNQKIRDIKAELDSVTAQLIDARDQIVSLESELKEEREIAIIDGRTVEELRENIEELTQKLNKTIEEKINLIDFNKHYTTLCHSQTNIISNIRQLIKDQ